MWEVLKSRPGWVETQDDVDWDLCWADVGWVRDMYDQIQVRGGQFLVCDESVDGVFPVGSLLPVLQRTRLTQSSKGRIRVDGPRVPGFVYGWNRLRKRQKPRDAAGRSKSAG